MPKDDSVLKELILLKLQHNTVSAVWCLSMFCQGCSIHNFFKLHFKNTKSAASLVSRDLCGHKHSNAAEYTFHWSNNCRQVRQAHISISMNEYTAETWKKLCVNWSNAWLFQYTILECALCGDANPFRLERQSCPGWYHTMGQPSYKVSQKYHFMFSSDSTLCKWGWIFYRELYSVTPDALTHNFFLSAGNNANPNPNLDPDLLNPKLITSTDGRGLLQCHVSIHSNQGFSFYCASIHTHTPIHTHTHIVTKWLQYRHQRVICQCR